MKRDSRKKKRKLFVANGGDVKREMEIRNKMLLAKNGDSSNATENYTPFFSIICC